MTRLEPRGLTREWSRRGAGLNLTPRGSFTLSDRQHDERPATCANKPEAQALADKASAAWVALARTGNPNTGKRPQWPACSASSRDTMLFNNDSRVERDADRVARLAMEKLLTLA